MNFKTFIQNLSAKVVILFSLAIFSWITLLNYVGIVSFQNLLKFNNISVLIIFLTLLIGLILPSVFIYKTRKNKYFVLYLFLFAFIIRLIWVLFIDTQPLSDFKVMYEGALDVVNGNKESLLNSYYFNTWVYQLGYTMYLAIFLKLFSGSLLALKLLNTLVVSLIPVVIYLTVKN